MIHTESSPLAGKTVKIKEKANELGGKEYQVEDWWDIVSKGKSWTTSTGNIACMLYGVRSGLSPNINIPSNDEVLYGKIGGLGHLVHVTEIES